MRCCVPNCKNDSRYMSKSQRITFHVLPTESGLCKSWLHALGKEELPKERSTVCSEHFLSDDLYETRSGLQRVRAGAVPLVLQDALNGQTSKQTFANMQKQKHLKVNVCDVNIQHTDTQADKLFTEVVEVKNEDCCNEIVSHQDDDSNLYETINNTEFREYAEEDGDEFVEMKNEDYINEMFMNENDNCMPNDSFKNDRQEERGEDVDEFVEVKNEDYINEMFMNENYDCYRDDSIDDTQEGLLEDANYASRPKKARQNKSTGTKIENLGQQNQTFQESPSTDTNTETIVPVVTDCGTSDADSSRTTKKNLKSKSKLDVQQNKPSRDTPEMRQAPAILNTSNNIKTSPNVINKTKEKMSLIRHIVTHTDEKPFSCDVCDKRFNFKFSLVRHLIIHTGEKPFACDVCDKKFNLKSNLNIHLRLHAGEKPFSCDVCNKKFNKKSNLNQHLKTHTGEKPFSCDVCDKKFTEKSKLKNHLRMHTGEKPFTCDVCDKKFNQKCNLNRHLRLHTGEKPFSCNVCDKNFNQKHHLDAHLSIHTGKMPFSCDVCDKKFTEKSKLKKHLRVHTGEKPFSCDVCYKKFTEKSQLKKHLRIHTGEKPFSCDVCDNFFYHEHHLDAHLRINTGEKPFSCDVCDKKFIHNIDLL